MIDALMVVAIEEEGEEKLSDVRHSRPRKTAAHSVKMRAEVHSITLIDALAPELDSHFPSILRCNNNYLFPIV